MSPAAGIPSFAMKHNGSLCPFEINIPDNAVEELRTLIRCSKIAGPTYETSVEGGVFGVSRQWLLYAKSKWEDFSWFVNRYAY